MLPILLKSLMKTVLISVLLVSLPGQYASASNCWKDAYGRGVGKPISACEDGFENDASLCYPFCREGFNGVGPVCWERCPSGFPDTGADCLKPQSYGRGAGYTSHSVCNEQHSSGCEQWGALWYPKCASNFHNVACCVCSPDCPAGMPDIGVSCQKQSYGRGVGKPLQCKKDEEYQAALCYTPCKQAYDGNGPVCWGTCPAGKFDCGALCVDVEEQCTDDVKEIVVDVTKLAIAIAEAAGGKVNIVDIITKIGKVAVDLANGICKAPSVVEFLLRKH